MLSGKIFKNFLQLHKNSLQVNIHKTIKNFLQKFSGVVVVGVWWCCGVVFNLFSCVHTHVYLYTIYIKLGTFYAHFLVFCGVLCTIYAVYTHFTARKISKIQSAKQCLQRPQIYHLIPYIVDQPIPSGVLVIKITLTSFLAHGWHLTNPPFRCFGHQKRASHKDLPCGVCSVTLLNVSPFTFLVHFIHSVQEVI